MQQVVKPVAAPEGAEPPPNWTNTFQSINQSVFLEWPKWQATARTTTGVTVNVTE